MAKKKKSNLSKIKIIDSFKLNAIRAQQKIIVFKFGIALLEKQYNISKMTAKYHFSDIVFML